MKALKILSFILFAGVSVPALAQSNNQTFNPGGSFTQTYSVLSDPSTGKLCTAAAPCSILASSGGGGGGAVTIADGASVNLGSLADTAYTGTGNATLTAALKGIYTNTANHSITAPAAGAWAGADGYAQASTTSGQFGILNQAAYTTATPALTSGTTNPLFLFSNGSLRVSIQAATGGSAAASNGALSVAGLFNTTPASVTTGVSAALESTADGSSHVAQTPSVDAYVGLAPVATAAASQVVVTGAHNLYGYNMVQGTTAGCLIFYDSATVPTTLVLANVRKMFPLAASQGVDFQSPIPIPFTAGIVELDDTTCAIGTVTAATPIFMSAQVR